MTFDDIRVLDIDSVVKYRASRRRWHTAPRRECFLGVAFGGVIRHRFPGHSFDIGANSVYFFNADEPYDAEVLEWDENCYSYTVHFLTTEPITCQSFAFKVRDSGEAERLIRRVETAPTKFAAISALYRLIEYVFLLRNKKYAPSDGRIERAKGYLDLHFKDENPLTQAAVASGLSRRRFNDLFKLQYSVTPNRYVVCKRIDFAKKLLALPYYAVGDVAATCGFSDIYYFSRVFKEETGLTPSAYRDGLFAPQKGGKPD